MASSIRFKTVQLLEFSRTATGGTAKFSSSLTQEIMKGMGWAEIPEFLKGGSPEGDLSATVITLTPNDEPLKRHAIELTVTRVHKFSVIRLELEGKKGKGHRQELRFSVAYSDIKGARKLEEYILTAGKSTLVVSYEKQATQADLPGTELKEEAQESLGVQ